jgi:hypothetical protein
MFAGPVYAFIAAAAQISGMLRALPPGLVIRL